MPIELAVLLGRIARFAFQPIKCNARTACLMGPSAPFSFTAVLLSPKLRLHG